MTDVANDIKYMDVDNFHKEGYLQEVNRRFFHPLGLALSVNVDEEGKATSLGKIWDYRDDPEGITFGPNMIDKDKMYKIHNDWAKKANIRQKLLGYVIQSV